MVSCPPTGTEGSHSHRINHDDQWCHGCPGVAVAIVWAPDASDCQWQYVTRGISPNHCPRSHATPSMPPWCFPPPLCCCCCPHTSLPLHIGIPQLGRKFKFQTCTRYPRPSRHGMAHESMSRESFRPAAATPSFLYLYERESLSCTHSLANFKAT
jgi:hypothetical protein